MGHHVLLLGRIKAAPEMVYYLQAAAQFGWSRNVLLNQIKAKAYERARVSRP
jgi:predicted nuclease of restriction endonuclease-like (RecB) superfamily